MIIKFLLFYLLTLVIISTNSYASELNSEIDEKVLPKFHSILNASFQTIKEKNITKLKYTLDERKYFCALTGNDNNKGNIIFRIIDKDPLEEIYKKLYNVLSSEIKLEFKYESIEIEDVESIENCAINFVGKNFIKASLKETFSSDLTLFGCDGPIILTAKRFKITDSFADVCPGKTVIEFRPSPLLTDQPIKCFQFIPHSSPVFMQADMDFENLTMLNLFVTQSDLIIEFNN